MKQAKNLRLSENPFKKLYISGKYARKKKCNKKQEIKKNVINKKKKKNDGKK